MFNLFGNFFFGRSSAQNNETTVDDESALITTSQDVCTQLNPTSSIQEDQLLMMTTSQTSTTIDTGSSTDLHKQWVIVERAKQQQQEQQQQQQISTSTTHLDDVKEEDESSSPNESEMPEERDEDDNDVFIGSFFDRNLFDEKQQPGEIPAQPTRDEWLITPLPCLTSITCSQRSLVDNDPLENLLIEHPSMSVFVTVTSSAMVESSSSSSSPSPKTPKSESAVFKVFSENVIEQPKKETKESSLDKMSVVISQRKRKGMDSASLTHQSPSPTSTIRRKASKRNKKSSPVSNNSSSSSSSSSTQPLSSHPHTTEIVSANKENSQVRTLMSSRPKTTTTPKLDSILLSKNQMKRKNKHANKSNNCIQRKFHKLQQPTVCC